jgi:hypothetical protein
VVVIYWNSVYDKADWNRGHALDLISEGARFESFPIHWLHYPKLLRYSLVITDKRRDITYVRPRPFPSKFFPIHKFPFIVSSAVCVRTLYHKIFFKGKAVPVHSVKENGGRRGITPLILSLGTVWRSVVNFTPRPLYVWEWPRYPLNKRLSGAQNWSRSFGVGKYFYNLRNIWNKSVT